MSRSMLNPAYHPQKDDIPVEVPIIVPIVDKPLGKIGDMDSPPQTKRKIEISLHTPNTEYKLQQIPNIIDMLENEQEK